MTQDGFNLHDYAEQAVTTAIYDKEWKTVYPALGLGNEVGEFLEADESGDREDTVKEGGDVLWYAVALLRDIDIRPLVARWSSPDQPTHAQIAAAAGEVQGLVKKALRDDAGVFSLERRHRVQVNVAGLLGMVDAVLQENGSSLGDAASKNLAKLKSRQQRGVLGGSGGDR